MISAASSALAGRAPSPQPAFTFAPRAAAPIESAAFLIGVTDRGEVRYIFQQRSSGDPAMDAQVALFLPRFDFRPAESSIAWGIATITWGDDAYGEKPKSP